MYDILQLNDMLVPELHDIAEKLQLADHKKLSKQDLIYKILDKQAVSPELFGGKPADASSDEKKKRTRIKKEDAHAPEKPAKEKEKKAAPAEKPVKERKHEKVAEESVAAPAHPHKEKKETPAKVEYPTTPSYSDGIITVDLSGGASFNYNPDSRREEPQRQYEKPVTPVAAPVQA
ncbi:MAG: Rho termination factor N-terminal domain-containing protein, partial [Bacteroidota bacterium]